jgi:hypothetical protein
MSRLAAVGDRIYVSDHSFCTAYGATFENVIHITSDKDRADGRACRACATGDGPGLIVRWSEGQPLTAMSVPLAEVAEFARRPGRLLVHCAGAVCLSPTLAIAAKVARGRDVMDAIRDLWSGLWEGYSEPPILMPDPMRELLNWADSRKWGRA